MSPRVNHSGLGIHNISKTEDISVPGFDLFTENATESGVKEFKTQIYHPIGGLVSAGPFEFRIITGLNEFLHTAFLRIGGCMKIVRQDGQALGDNDDVSVVNLAPDLLWKSITFEVGNVKVEDTSHAYAFKAFFEKTLSQSISSKETHLRNDFYHEDTPAAMNAYTKDSGNGGYNKRQSFLKNSKELQFNSVLALDVCGISKPLPPRSVYTITINRNSDDFTLMTAQNDYKIEIPELYLEAVKLIPYDNLLGQIEKRFSSSPLKYEITRTKLSKFSIPQGMYDGSRVSLFDRGQLPRFILIGLTNQHGYNGTTRLNPFNFNHYDISEVCLTKNNIPVSK